ncbi:ABC transporter substrate-binding protein [Corynebacterium lubricantis]|uniref:taurine ABC transporter substrate-binding protein n=1 Tax=Corynebacterium lubricantis TaxID=541095 RepID=UPI0003619A93|nr:ABC transporter substrate-binding protein [Corynebacterium lubricantis]
MKKYLSTIATVAISGLALTGCVGAPASTYEISGDVTCPVTPAESDGQLRIGYQVIAGSTLYLRDQGLAEACFPNADVSWVRFPTGQDVVQGFVSESIDFGVMGSPPAANGLSQPIDLDAKIIRTNNITGTGEALVARDSTGIVSIQDLRGKRIATGANSTSHYSLLKTLEAEGIDPSNDVELVFLTPDTLPGAWASGDIDAAYIWGPALAEIKKTGTTLITSAEVAEDGAPTFQFTLGTDKIIASNPDYVQVWTQLEDYAVSIYRTDPEPYILANSVQIGLGLEETKSQLEGAEEIIAPEATELHKDITDALYNTAEFLDQQAIATAVDRSHYEEAVLVPETRP